MRVESTGLKRWREKRRLINGPRNAITLGFVALSLGGCMSLAEKVPPSAELRGSVADAEVAPPPEPAVSVPVEPAPRIRKVSRVKPASRVPSQDKVAIIDPDSLIGMEPGEVRKLLGTPVRTRNDQLPREWIYGTGRCSFRVFFYPNLNTAAFRVLKYGSSDGNGEMIDTSDVCIRHILMARKNAAD
jgi:hypothetical protein